jgi:hypothetical protein
MKNTIEQQQNGRLQTGVSTNRRFSLRNGLLLVAGAIGLLAAGSGQAQPSLNTVFPLPFYEPFPTNAYPYSYNSFYTNMGYAHYEYLGEATNPPTSANTSQDVWTIGNSVTSSSAHIMMTNNTPTGPGLEYPGLLNVDATYHTGLVTLWGKNTGSTKDRAVQLAIPGNNRSAPFPIYASCLIDIVTNGFSSTTMPYPFFGLATNTTTNNTSVNHSGAVVYVNQQFQLQISKGSSTAATNLSPVIASNAIHLIVLRYNYTGPGSNDSVDLWIDPITLGSNFNATVPTPTLTTTNNANAGVNYYGAVAIFEEASPCTMFIDEIRVATNWGGVTPTNAWSGGIYSVTGGELTSCTGQALTIGLNGSDSGVTYWLCTNGVPTGISAAGTGSAITFSPGQTTTATYTVFGSNTLATPSAATTWMSGSASVLELAPVVITAPPVPMTVPSGELGVFSVGSTGAQTFQWYKGSAPVSGSEFSGAQSSNLVIFPVTSQDVGSYYVVVMNNACSSSVQSSSVALTIESSPNNLTWYPDGVTNSWDVGISSNWLNSSDNPVTFNWGDNVTFDSTSQYTTVNLNNPNLSPTLATVNAGISGGSYNFYGPGGLAGSGSMVVNGNLILNLGFLNAETNTMTINSGASVTFNSAANLGLGTIVLAGGQLAGAGVGALSVDNVIKVNGAGSSIAVNSPGGASLTLTNNLIGTSGDLSIDNLTAKNAGTGTVSPLVMQYPNFTFNLPVTLNADTAGGIVLLSGGNTNGVQEWEGLITGVGGVQRDGAGGVTRMDDAANNYTGETLLTDGAMAVASDSVFSGSTLVSGPLGAGSLVIDTRTGTPQICATNAAHAVGNPITWYSNVLGSAWVISGNYPITFSGPMDLNANLATQPYYLTGDNRAIVVSNGVSATFSGVISDDGNNMGLTLTGTGNVYLDGANTYTGTTSNSTDMLAGTGSVAGQVVIETGATLGAGDASGIGTFTLNGGLTLGGNLFIRVNNAHSPSNDTFVVTGGVTNVGSGTVTVTNLGAALAVGNRYVLFSVPVVGGTNLTVTGGGVMAWTNNLAYDGSISVLTLNKTTPTLTTAPTASSIIYGQALSNSILSGGVASVPGTFAFTTPTLTPGLGTANQSVTFTPSNTNLYNTFTFNVSVTVLLPPTPAINAVSASAGNLIFSGTNGTAGLKFYVLSTTDLTLPLTNWTVVSTNTFGAGGLFSVTNTISSSPRQLFFTVEVP